jgi:hypothetical protein
MKIIESNIPTALGDLINIKTHLDAVKHEYDQIRLNFHQNLFNMYFHTNTSTWPQNKAKWDKFLNEISQLFFSESPYIFGQGEYPFRETWQILRDFDLKPQKTELADLLCRGTSLNVGGEYIVLTTKIRYLKRAIFNSVAPELWPVLRELSKKYKLVVLGERVVERNKDYINWTEEEIYGIYPEIMANLDTSNLLDLTVPALGESAPDLKQIMQDCLIMNEAKFVVTLGVGGNFCMSTSTAKMAIGYRTDGIEFTDVIFNNREYPNAIITKNWPHFVNTLQGYL